MADLTRLNPVTFFRRAIQAAAFTISGVDASTWFGPSQPLQPMAPADVKGRAFDYPFAYNLQYIPRATEQVSFATLKRFSMMCDLLRIVIETRKDQLEGLNWSILPRSIEKGKRPAESKFKSEIQNVTELLRSPDKRHDWCQWSRALNEQLYVYDAVTIEPVTTRGGDLFSLELVDGATISPKLGADGRLPLPPSPAYQQILKGIPAINYTTDELVYYPKNPRVDHVYGYSRVEQIYHYVEMMLARMQQQIDYFGAGNIPDGFIEGPASMSTDQLKSWQVYWDSIFEGNIAQRRHAWWVPAGTKYTGTKSDPAQDEFDAWLARIICYCFSTSPQPLLKMMNRATAQSAAEEAEAEGLRPDMQYISRLINRIIWKYTGNDAIEFVWDEDTEFDPFKKATMDQIYVKNAIKTVDEVRDENGLDPFGEDWSSSARYFTATGIIDPNAPPEPVAAPGSALPGGAQGKLPAPGQGNQGANGTPPKGAQSAGAKAPGDAKKPTPKSGTESDAAKDTKKSMPVELALCVTRPLLNTHDLDKWASENKLTLKANPHVTLAYSRIGVDPRMINESVPTIAVEDGSRKLDKFGNALVLRFSSDDLNVRHQELMGAGMSHDFDEYNSHVTIAWDPSVEGIDVESLTPYQGPLLFGPEEFASVDVIANLPNDVEAPKMSYEEVTAAANEAAASPSAAQIEAGNYRKGHVNIQGLDVSIESPKGSTRSGTAPDGTQWSVTLPAHYGYIKRTEGADGEHVDTYLGTNPNSQTVWVIDQHHLETGKFDEHKVMVGYDRWSDAMSDYLSAFSDGNGASRLGGVTAMSMAEFKDWLDNGDTKSKLTGKTVTVSTGLVAHDVRGQRRSGTELHNQDQNNESSEQKPWPVNKGKVPKDSVEYGPGKPNEQCGTCVNYRLNAPDFESGACTKVAGLIDADHWCKLFERDEKEVGKSSHRPFIVTVETSTNGPTTKAFNPDQPRDKDGKWIGGAGENGHEVHEALLNAGYTHEGGGMYSNAATGTKAQMQLSGKGSVWKPGMYGSTHTFEESHGAMVAHANAAAGIKGTMGKPMGSAGGSGGKLTPGQADALFHQTFDNPKGSMEETKPGNAEFHTTGEKWTAGYFQGRTSGVTVERISNAKPMAHQEADKLFTQGRSNLDALPTGDRDKIISAISSHKGSTTVGKDLGKRDALDQAMAKIGVTLERDTVFYRGISLHKDSAMAKVMGAIDRAKNQGADAKASVKIRQFSDRFVPTTTDKGVAKGFGAHVIMRVVALKGTKVLPIRDIGNKYYNEHEVTFNRGTVFRIAGYEGKTGMGQHIITVVPERGALAYDKKSDVGKLTHEDAEQNRTDHFGTDFIIEVDDEPVYAEKDGKPVDLESIEKAGPEDEERDEHGRWTSGGGGDLPPGKNLTRDEAKSLFEDSHGNAVTYYHGSGQSLSRFGTSETYLTSDKAQATEYATGAHLGSSRGGVVHEVDVTPGQVRDISNTISAAVSEGRDLDTAITHVADKARKEGVAYLTYEHPNASGGGDHRVLVSLNPRQDLSITGKERVGKIEKAGPEDEERDGHGRWTASGGGGGGAGGKPGPKLTAEQNAAVDKYIGGKDNVDVKVNEYLRTGKAATSETKQIAEHLQRAIANNKLGERMTVYRGVQTPVSAFEGRNGLWMKGITSTTTDRGWAQEFTGEEEKGTVLEIKIGKNMPALDLRGRGTLDEQEVLLQHNSFYIVNKVDTKNSVVKLTYYGSAKEKKK